jgi:hypothetical protein
MKRTPFICSALTCLALLTFNTQLSTAHAQGSLTPPGPPAPTMKSLDQVEARTPISSAPFTITNSGSYYLTTNVSVSSGDGITIAANNVTLDLNGFTLSSTDPANTGSGITTFHARTNLIICNGYVSGSVTNQGGIFSGNGFGEGIGLGSSSAVRVTGVTLTGCLFFGISLSPDSSSVQSCVVRTIGSHGIIANSVSDSTALNCAGYGIDAAVVNNSYGESTGGTGGVFAETASNCRGNSSSSGIGVQATSAINCYGVSSSGYGVYAIIAENCYGTSSTGTGMTATSAINCYAVSMGSGDGLDASAAQNCWGTSDGSGTGVNANTANNCTGTSNTGTGLYAGRTAIGCDGESTGGTGIFAYTGVAVGSFGHSSTGLGLKAYVANGCYGQNGSGTSEFTGNTGTDQRYNMP